MFIEKEGLGFMFFPKKVLWESAMLFGRNSCQLMFETPCLNIVEVVLVTINEMETEPSTLTINEMRTEMLINLHNSWHVLSFK